ncbi:gfo/Idh/MocA family oxidoreductase [Marinomonas piezotolerans]|uniref:Gfo/Idh/MocA family oxidoreductase n=1 Tax=Marinomonas piezotolerans TaxID=2213058 RepID=A0A370U8G0_9GAMM|nr:Gfo/Idh/MocA family oxidoreductase [Marinomonas piezotolerans]RDL44018.1 gfo/Idh/MocA family oxidoreductase [Marinomonas piezotolerans]
MQTVAVIGLGNIAKRHRSNLKHLFPDCKLLAMSASGRVPDELVSNCDEIVTSIEEIILANTELVVIASPASLHVQHAIPLLNARIPTLIEKPISMSSSESQRIIDVSLTHSAPVAVGYCLRYLPSANYVKNALDKCLIGKIYNAYIETGQYLPDWRPNIDYRDSVSAQENLGGGALLELSHELDYAQWLLGSLNLEHAILRRSEELSLDVEDCVDIIFKNDAETVINIHMDMLQRKAYRKCRFVGSAGVLEWDLIGNSLKLIDSESETMLYENPSWDKNQMYLYMLEDFINKIEGKCYSCVDINEAHQIIILIENIKSSYNQYQSN